MMIRCLILAAALIIPAAENHAPVVKLISPADHATVTSGSRYQVSVSDTEDGDSQYDEINPKEVILELSPGKPTDPEPLKAPGLAVMARSNCFNCHNFNGKLIGPSLFDIAKRNTNTDTMTQRIKNGSAGVWGKEKMPSHPELSIEDIHNMVQWIKRYAAAPGMLYQNGISGVLQAPKPGAYTLTACYTDHGPKDGQSPKDSPGQHLTGADHITITVK